MHTGPRVAGVVERLARAPGGRAIESVHFLPEALASSHLPCLARLAAS